MRVLCPAKLNLYLEVLGRRPDGYHAVLTLMQTVDLQDELTLRRGHAGVRLECDSPGVGAGDANLVARAARAWLGLQAAPEGVDAVLRKRIPPGAGLGGGSSDAAGTLAGLQALFERPDDPEGLDRIARGLGSDVPFFLRADTALCRGRGDEVEPLSQEGRLHYVLAMPRGPLPTAAVYAELRAEEALRGLTAPGPSLSILREAVCRSDARGVASGLHNRLLAPALRLAPALGEDLEAFARLGCAGVSMSGSGSCLFGVCRGDGEAMEVEARARAFWGDRVWRVAGPAGGPAPSRRNQPWTSPTSG
ncbi:MAG: 4-(cytidine 5'-diphospho)-2-C-methyl-D-erythritol kinase [Planctomycetes bacterium]|nr:4-(cytidine 5'-diphospho)-2-C-methyl-D-erythritol kinase [Planctomycetota bacterium]